MKKPVKIINTIYAVLLFILFTINMLREKEVGVFVSFGSWTSWLFNIMFFIYAVIILIALGIRVRNNYRDKK